MNLQSYFLIFLLTLLPVCNVNAYFSVQTHAGSALQINDETHIIEDTNLIQRLANTALFHIGLLAVPAALATKNIINIKLNPAQRESYQAQAVSEARALAPLYEVMHLWSYITLAYYSMASANYGYQLGKNHQAQTRCDRKQGVAPVYIDSPFLASLFHIQVNYNEQQPSVHITRLSLVEPVDAIVPEDQQVFADWLKLYRAMSTEKIVQLELAVSLMDGDEFLSINQVSEDNHRFSRLMPLQSTSKWYFNSLANWCDETESVYHSLLAPDTIVYLAESLADHFDKPYVPDLLSASERGDALLLDTGNSSKPGYRIVHSNRNAVLSRSPGFFFLADKSWTEDLLLDIAVSPYAEREFHAMSAQKLWSPYVVRAMELSIQSAIYPAMRLSILKALSCLPTQEGSTPGFGDIANTKAGHLLTSGLTDSIDLQTTALATIEPSSSVLTYARTAFNFIVNEITEDTKGFLYIGNQKLLRHSALFFDENPAPKFSFETVRKMKQPAASAPASAPAPALAPASAPGRSVKDIKKRQMVLKQKRAVNDVQAAEPVHKKAKGPSDYEKRVFTLDPALDSANQRLSKVLQTMPNSFAVWSDVYPYIHSSMPHLDDDQNKYSEAWILDIVISSKSSEKVLQMLLKEFKNISSTSGTLRHNDELYRAFRIIKQDEDTEYSKPTLIIAEQVVEFLNGGTLKGLRDVGKFEGFNQIEKPIGIWQDYIFKMVLDDTTILETRIKLTPDDIVQNLSAVRALELNLGDEDFLTLDDLGWTPNRKLTLENILDKSNVHGLPSPQVFRALISKEQNDAVDIELTKTVLKKLLGYFQAERQFDSIKIGVAQLIVHGIGLEHFTPDLCSGRDVIGTSEPAVMKNPEPAVMKSSWSMATGSHRPTETVGGEDEAYKELYQKYYSKLVRQLPFSDVLFKAQLITNRLMPGNGGELIDSKPTSADKATTYLTNVIKAQENRGEFERLLNVCSRSEYRSLQKLAQQIKSELSDLPEITAPSPLAKITTQRASDVLRQFHVQLLDLPLDNPVFLAKLYSENLLPSGLYQQVQVKQTRAEKAGHFMNSLISSTRIFTDQFLKLLNIMENSDDDAMIALAQRITKELMKDL